MKTIILDDETIFMCADEDGVPCHLTGENGHYFGVYKDDQGNKINLSISVDEVIFTAIRNRHWSEIGKPMKLVYKDVEFLLVDNRTYGTFFEWWNEPEYMGTELDQESHWLAFAEPLVEVLGENPESISTIHISYKDLGGIYSKEIVGYDGILKGDKVEHQGKNMYVVMVSRFGHFGLSINTILPYSTTALPNEVKRCG